MLTSEERPDFMRLMMLKCISNYKGQFQRVGMMGCDFYLDDLQAAATDASQFPCVSYDQTNGLHIIDIV